MAGEPRVIETVPLNIVGDAGIASPLVSGGRMIPVVILDTTERPDIVEYIRVHEYVSEGDVRTQRGLPRGGGRRVVLLLSVIRPVELGIGIAFDIDSQGIIVQQILDTRLLYVQAGKAGDRVKHNPDAPKVIFEIPDTGTRPQWDKTFLNRTIAKLRADGLPRQQAKHAARSIIAEMRKVSQIRVPTPESFK